MQSDGTIRKYYSFAGQTVALRDANGLQYFLSDHLGSIVAITDASGTLTSQQRYLPFGQVRADITGPQLPITDLGYTGQRDLGELGLIDYRARFYHPVLARFVQPDTMIPGTENPQNWNRFAYTLNNPIRYTDPSGHTWEPPFGPITIADISNWPKWAQFITGLVVSVVGLVVDNGKIRTMNAEEGMAAFATTPMTVSFPRNYKYAKDIFFPSDPKLKSKYPNGVKFDADGYPDFSPYSKVEVDIDMSGNRYWDEIAANEAAGFDITPDGFTWHHHQNRRTMQLVPSDLHRAIAHTGGVSIIKRIGRIIE